jgi:Ku70/Ku80-like protein
VIHSLELFGFSISDSSVQSYGVWNDGPRANWKGFLRLSLVTCPVALYPATSEAEKISFNQINKGTGHRIRYLKVDADTGEEVPPRHHQGLPD